MNGIWCTGVLLVGYVGHREVLTKYLVCTLQEYGIIGYRLLENLIEYKTLVMREDMDAANAILPTIPKVEPPAPWRQMPSLITC